MSLNDLFSGFPRDADRNRRCREAAEVLMGYARANPDPYRGRLVPVIVYDPRKARRAYVDTLAKLAK